MNQYEVMVGNASFYINANSEYDAQEQLAMIMSRISDGFSAILNGDVLVGKQPAESIPKSLLQ